MTDAVTYEQDGSVVTLTLNRPETRNAITEDVYEAIISHCDNINTDLSVRCIILTGAGKGFSSGGNVKDMRDRTSLFGGTAGEIRSAYRDGIQRFPLALYRLEVPIIAAVNGAAIGAGFDIAMMCDMRIASTQASFAEVFVKLGIIPGDGGAWFLPRAIGMARAAEMAFTGDRLDAETALEWGLVSRVVKPEDLMDEARALADRVAANPPEALRMTKRLIREGQRVDLETLLELSCGMQAIAHHTSNHREAVDAMFEKRDPKFTAGE
ncbi:MAG: enoyl-CoA hydratase [Alphaproteobacteria bacterium]|nr:enoyl-CoA hydratase [Alphaproteobacteria bacterium]|tara:strand:+ start:5268 stop:6068 length:801 start_codon:yes stop_codon:yes gene_type:complete